MKPSVPVWPGDRPNGCEVGNIVPCTRQDYGLWGQPTCQDGTECWGGSEGRTIFLTMSRALGSGRLAAGEILATGDVLWLDTLSVGRRMMRS